MNVPPIGPRIFHITYGDGRVETVEAEECLACGEGHVLYSSDWTEVLRVPHDVVVSVTPSKAHGKTAFKRRV